MRMRPMLPARPAPRRDVTLLLRRVGFEQQVALRNVLQDQTVQRGVGLQPTGRLRWWQRVKARHSGMRSRSGSGRQTEAGLHLRVAATHEDRLVVCVVANAPGLASVDARCNVYAARFLAICKPGSCN